MPDHTALPRTVVADRAIVDAWRTGPRWFHVVVAAIDEPRVERRRREIVSALPDLLRVTTPGQAHVTLWVCGFDTEPVLPARTRVDLLIGGVGTFASAAYLTVDGESIPYLRQKLAQLNRPENRTSPYVPHVTLGTYRRELPLTDVHRQLAPWRELPPIPTTARIRHMVVDARSPVGELFPPGRHRA